MRIRCFIAGLMALGTSAAACAAQAGSSVATRATAAAETFDVGMLRVERFGTRGRPAVILVPALFCGSWQWNREIDSLSKRYDVYALTLPGFDGRPSDSSGDLMNRAVSNLSDLIRQRTLKRPVIVGHSLGGTIAVLFGERHSDLAAGIIAVEGGYPIAPTPALRTQRVNASVAGYEQARPSTLDGVLRSQTLRYVITSPRNVDSVAKYASTSDPAAIVEWMRAALLLDLTGELHAIRAPLIEIVPFDSTIDPYQGFATLAAKRDAYTAWLAHAPRGSLVMIDHSRHFVMFDQPRGFDAALFTTIAKLSEAGSVK